MLSKNIYFNTLKLIPHSLRYQINKIFFRKNFFGLQRLREIQENNLRKASLKGFDELKCIFVHIPKAAGLSVNNTLFGNAGGVHRSIFQYSLIFNKSEFNSYYKFAFVRNPWDRLASAYFFLKQGGLHNNDAKWAKENLSHFNSFEEFVKIWVNKVNIEKELHFKPQYKFITINGKIRVDDVFKFETINQDFEKICEKLKLQKKLPHLNKTKNKKNYRDYYNDETKKIVEKVYKKDIELFDYYF